MEKPENISWIPQQELEDPFKKYLNSAEDYLAFLCGPPRSHLFFPVTAVYALIFAVGVVGNLLVCLVILRHQAMKTPTNYYLFSLAISDLLVLLLGMPLEVYEMWRNYPFLFGSVGCYFKTALFETVCFASILSVTTLHYFPNGSLVPGSATCAVIKPMWIYNFIIQVTSFLFYILPMTVISVLYYLMGLRLKKDQSLVADEVTANIQRPSRKSVTKMLFVLVLVFAICWTPFHIDRLFFSFVEEWTESLAAVFNLIHVVSGVFFYLSSAVNPIIYNVLSRRFRAAFWNVISPSRKQWHSQHHPQGLPTQRNIFPTECHLVELTEDASPQFPCQLSTCSPRLPAALYTTQAPQKGLPEN
ncbi:Neuromedin-U Receptor 2 [Manis pentadactyla]|nr:Neuromedin-U Receptor 2 [Manis pentadactyla]